MTSRRISSLGRMVPLALALVAGCLGHPDVEERWTNLEMVETNVLREDFALGGEPITVKARLTFQEILTGAFVAELRASDTVTSDMVHLDHDEQPIGTARDVDFILENSVTAGRDPRSVTGFPQLRRDVEFSFETFEPIANPQGLFLLLYMGDEEEIELEDGRDSLLITPFFSTEYDILSKAIALPLDTGTNPGP